MLAPPTHVVGCRQLACRRSTPFPKSRKGFGLEIAARELQEFQPYRRAVCAERTQALAGELERLAAWTRTAACRAVQLLDGVAPDRQLPELPTGQPGVPEQITQIGHLGAPGDRPRRRWVERRAGAVAPHLAQAGLLGEQSQQRLVVLPKMNREPRAAIRDAEAALGADEAAYVTPLLPRAAERGGTCLGAAEPTGRGQFVPKLAKPRATARAVAARPYVDGVAPHAKLGGTPSVKPAWLDHRQQLPTVILAVDDPRDLWPRSPLSRDASQAPDAGNGEQPLEQVLLVVALVEDHLASQRLSAVLLVDPEVRLALQEPGE